MTFKTVIQPSGHNFPIEEHETILEAALRHGYTLPYSCRDGVCGTCKGKVVTGQVDYGKYQDSTLSETEKAAGMALFCCATPLSDLVPVFPFFARGTEWSAIFRSGPFRAACKKWKNRHRMSW